MDEVGDEAADTDEAQLIDDLLFVGILCQPERHFVRVSERCSVRDQVTLRRDTELTIDLRLADGQRPRAGVTQVLPLVPFRKDQLLNGHPVTCADGRLVHILHRAESHRFHADTVKAAVRAAAPVELPESVVETAANDLSRIPIEDERTAQAMFDRWFRDPDEQAHSPEANRLRESLRGTRVQLICEQLIAHHYILARFVTDEHQLVTLKLTYDIQSHNFDPFEHARRSPTRLAYTLGAAYRSYMAQLPQRFLVPAPLACQCQSYHFRMSGPSTYFVRRQRLMLVRPDQHETDETIADRLATITPSEHGGGRLIGDETDPTSEAHLYAGHLHRESLHGRVHAFVEFWERPPGTQAAAAILSLLVALMLALYGIMLDEVMTAGNSAALTAVLLAVPSLGAGWVLPRSVQRRQAASPATAELSTAVTTLLALIAAVAFVVGHATTRTGESPSSTVEYLWWSLTIAAAITSVITIGYVLHTARCYRNALDHSSAVGREPT